MAYEKQNFIPGQKLKAAQMNHIEEGLADVTDFANDINKDISEVYKTRNYIFTGSYTNVGGQYQVALDDNYSWNHLVAAVRSGRYVVCVLFDEDRLLPLIFTAGEVFIEDGYVNLHSDGEGTVRRELYIYENGDLELYEVSLATRAEMAGRLAAYTFTGEYTENDAGGYDVAFDSNYSWAKLVNAVNAGRHVFCTLRNNARNRVYMTLTESMIGDDSYVVFTANVEFTRVVWKMTVFSDGVVLYAERFAPETDSGGVTIDLLWEDSGLGRNTVSASAQVVNVPIQNLLQYDLIQVVHITDDTYCGTTIFASDALANWGAMLSLDYEGEFMRRSVNMFEKNGLQWLMFYNPNEAYACVPVRIYGITGVRSASVLQTCRVDAETSDLISFELGMTWGEWCDSPYNAFKDPYYISDGELNNGAGSLILNPSGSRVSSSDYIGVGVVYHGA